MEPLETFANVRGAQTSSTVLRRTELADKIVEAAEPKMVLKQICADFEIPYLTTTVPKDEGDGDAMAVEVGEGSNIPIFRSKMTSFPIALHKNATAIFMTKEAEMQDFKGDLYQREINKAGKRMARKTDYDVAVVLSGASASQSASVSGMLHTYDIALVKAHLELLGYEADTIVMNPIQWADIEGEATLHASATAGASVFRDYEPGVRAQGESSAGASLMGLKVLVSSRVTAGTCYVMDQSAEPIWRFYNGATDTETFTREGVGRGAMITAFEKPVLVVNAAVEKITSC